MKPRTQSILEASVREFIKTGRPITSEILYEEYDFGIKPAMIRLELGALSEEGYFYQTHPSGGRYPTDKAYRAFAEEVIRRDEQVESMGWFDEEKIEENLKDLVGDVSKQLGVLMVGFNIFENSVIESGLSELIERMPLSAKKEILSVVNDFEAMEERIQKKRQWIERESTWPQVFIGESPITKCKDLSVVAGKVQSDGNEVVLFSIGPKCMDYEKAIHIMKLFSKM